MAGKLAVRLVAVFFGLATAFLAAGMFISAGVYAGYFQQLFADLEITQAEAGPLAALVVVALGLLSSFQIAGFALAPALIAIVVAELLCWNGLAANLVLGGLVGLAAGWLLAGGTAISQGPALVLLATGFVAGFAYWLIAGRNAGNWRQ